MLIFPSVYILTKQGYVASEMAQSIRSFNKILFVSPYRGFRIKPRLITSSAINLCDSRENKTIALEDVAALLKSRNSWTSLEIQDLKNKLIGREVSLRALNKHHNIDEQTVNSVILKSCEKFGLVETGINYFKTLVENGHKISVAETRVLFDLVKGNKDLSEENKNFLYEQYQHLMTRYDVLDNLTLGSCVRFLILYDEYINDAINIVESKGMCCENVNKCWDYIAGAAFQTGQVNLGWESLRKIPEKNYGTLRFNDVEKAITGYINYCNEKVKNGTFSVEEFEKIFQFLSDYNINAVKGRANVIFELRSFLDKLNESYEKDYTWKLSFVKVESGHCSSCNNDLEKTVLDEKSFNDLRTTFLSDVIIGKDVFIKSSPEEVKRYYKFLRSTPHFDVIIDGLNVAYANESSNPNTKIRIQRVSMACKKLITM